MATNSVQIVTPVGRLVAGHPLDAFPVTDDRTNQPKLDAAGQPRTSTFVALAIPKGQEQHWNQTEWGSQIYAVGQQGWPNGEYNSPQFAWKITDGDSAVPNKRGRKPCDQEGYHGHWVLNCSTELSVNCFHAGRYSPGQEIRRKEEIKRGDYVRLVLNIKDNNPSQTPGVYINPTIFELFRAGVEIKSSNAPDPRATLGAVHGQLPAGAQIDTSVAAPAQTAPVNPPGAMPAPNYTGTVQPAHDFLKPPPAPPAAPVPTGPVMTAKAGGATYDAFIAQGWTDEMMRAQGYLQ